jgi:hypothetical protein
MKAVNPRPIPYRGWIYTGRENPHKITGFVDGKPVPDVAPVDLKVIDHTIEKRYVLALISSSLNRNAMTSVPPRTRYSITFGSMNPICQGSEASWNRFT